MGGFSQTCLNQALLANGFNGFKSTRNDSSVSSLVVLILSSDFPLNATDIFSLLKTSFNKSVSYQAVAKSLRFLLKNEIVGRDRRLYFLNPDWIKNMHDFFSTASGKYAKFTQEDMVVRFLFNDV